MLRSLRPSGRRPRARPAGRLGRRLRLWRFANVFSVLAAVATISLIAAGSQFAIVVHRENQLANRYSDSLWWFTAQFRSELQQLHISIAGFDGSQDSLDDLRDRYEILLSRVQGLDASTLDPTPGPALEHAMRELCDDVMAIGPRVEGLRPGRVDAARALSRDIFAFDRLAGRMSTLGAQDDGAHRESVRSAIDRANMMFGGALVLLIGSLLLSLRAVYQQARARDAARRRSEALSADLTVALAQAQAGLRAKDVFLATMSHEIRTPMNGVLGAVSLLSQSTLDDRQRRWVAIVKACAEALMAQLDDVLDYSAMEAASLRLESEAFDIRLLAEDISQVVESAAAEQGLDLVVVVDPDVPLSVVTDHRRLAQVLLNLLSNAVKFTGSGGVLLRVSLRRRLGRVWLRAAVADSGPGIARADRARIFDEFTRLERTGGPSVRGTGLGLAISQRIAVALGGRIRVTGMTGGGSLFCFAVPVEIGPGGPIAALGLPRRARIGLAAVEGGATCVRRGLERLLWARGYATAPATATRVDLLLRHSSLPPAAASTAQAAAVVAFGPGSRLDSPLTEARLAAALSGRAGSVGGAREWPSARVAASSARRLRLLVADDDAINREIAASLLRHLGHETLNVADGAQALAALRAEAFDAGLVDLNMPHMSGAELARAVRALPPPAGMIRLIALTADAATATRDAVRAAGIDLVLTKPVTLERLADALRPLTHGADSQLADAGGGADPATAGSAARPVIAEEVRAMLVARLPQGRLPRLVQSFWDGVPALLDCVGGADARETDRRLHSIAGSAGSLGYAAVSEAARRARDAVRHSEGARALAPLWTALEAALLADAPLLAADSVAAIAARLAAPTRAERAGAQAHMLDHVP